MTEKEGEIIEFGLTPEQQQCLDYLFDKETIEVLYSGGAGGKFRLIAPPHISFKIIVPFYNNRFSSRCFTSVKCKVDSLFSEFMLLIFLFLFKHYGF